MVKNIFKKINRTTNFLEVMKRFLFGFIIILLFITALMFWLYVFTYSENWREISILMVQLLRFSGMSFVLVFVLYYLFLFIYDILYKKATKKIDMGIGNGFHW